MKKSILAEATCFMMLATLAWVDAINTTSTMYLQSLDRAEIFKASCISPCEGSVSLSMCLRFALQAMDRCHLLGVLAINQTYQAFQDYNCVSQITKDVVCPVAMSLQNAAHDAPRNATRIEHCLEGIVRTFNASCSAIAPPPTALPPAKGQSGGSNLLLPLLLAGILLTVVGLAGCCVKHRYHNRLRMFGGHAQGDEEDFQLMNHGLPIHTI